MCCYFRNIVIIYYFYCLNFKSRSRWLRWVLCTGKAFPQLFPSGSIAWLYFIRSVSLLSFHGSPPPPSHSSKRVFFTSGLLDKINNINNVCFCFTIPRSYSFYWEGRYQKAQGRGQAEGGSWASSQVEGRRDLTLRAQAQGSSASQVTRLPFDSGSLLMIKACQRAPPHEAGTRQTQAVDQASLICMQST